MGSIFGKKPKSTQSSTSQSTQSSDSRSFNNYWPQAQEDFGGFTANGGGANNAMAALLGLGGDTGAQDAAFQNYRDSTGYQFGLDQGTQAITGGAASKGLLNSGSTAKALSQFGQDYASTKFNDYLTQLSGLAGQGLQAGSLLGNVGQESISHSEGQSTSSSQGKSGGGKGGLGGLLGAGASLVAASDRRLKTNIVKLYDRKDGLGVYSYNYINGKGPYKGVMADEVEKIMPEALGPVIDGYATVDYAKIGAI
jgi:hypothetical protein